MQRSRPRCFAGARTVSEARPVRNRCSRDFAKAEAARKSGSTLHLVQASAESAPDRLRRAAPELAFYRKYTEGMLRRYVRMSMEAGRVPSMLGRDLFRAKVTNYEVHSFEDVVIFVCDVERCLNHIDAPGQKLLRRIAMQEYTQSEVADMLGMTERTLGRRYNEALDRLTALFLDRKLLRPMLP